MQQSPLLEKIDRLKHARCYDYERLALAKQLVYTASNLRFGPEVGVGEESRAEATGLQSPFSVGCAINKTAPSCGQASYGLSCKGRPPDLVNI